MKKLSCSKRSVFWLFILGFLGALSSPGGAMNRQEDVKGHGLSKIRRAVDTKDPKEKAAKPKNNKRQSVSHDLVNVVDPAPEKPSLSSRGKRPTPNVLTKTSGTGSGSTEAPPNRTRKKSSPHTPSTESGTEGSGSSTRQTKTPPKSLRTTSGTGSGSIEKSDSPKNRKGKDLPQSQNAESRTEISGSPNRRVKRSSKSSPVTQEMIEGSQGEKPYKKKPSSEKRVSKESSHKEKPDKRLSRENSRQEEKDKRLSRKNSRQEGEALQEKERSREEQSRKKTSRENSRNKHNKLPKEIVASQQMTDIPEEHPSHTRPRIKKSQLQQRHSLGAPLPSSKDTNSESLFARGHQACKQEDYHTAIPFLEKAAELGNIKAIYLTGYCYQQLQQEEQAKKYFESFARQQSPQKLLEHVQCLYQSKEFSCAEVFLKSPSLQKEAEAQFILGALYQKKENFKQAIESYTCAAKQGHVRAQTNLSYLYGEGLGVPQNSIEEIKWLTAAANQGDTFAQHNLGYAYEVQQDYTQAEKWYTLAAQQGDIDAKTALDNLHQHQKQTQILGDQVPQKPTLLEKLFLSKDSSSVKQRPSSPPKANKQAPSRNPHTLPTKPSTEQPSEQPPLRQTVSLSSHTGKIALHASKQSAHVNPLLLTPPPQPETPSNPQGRSPRSQVSTSGKSPRTERSTPRRSKATARDYSTPEDSLESSRGADSPRNAFGFF